MNNVFSEEILSQSLTDIDDSYLEHAWKDHKYIQKIGDRYFYTVKALQAYYNRKKADVAAGLSDAARQRSRTLANKAFEASTKLIKKNSSGKLYVDGDASRKVDLYNRRSQFYKNVSDNLAAISLKSISKVYSIEFEVYKRIVQREAETKIDSIEMATLKRGMQWLAKYGIYI